MIKASFKTGRAVPKLESKLRHTAKVTNFTEPLDALVKDLQDLMIRRENIFRGSLLASIGYSIKDIKRAGLDRDYEIHFGYITGLPQADKLEGGSDPHFVPFYMLLDWVKSKKEHRGKSVEDQSALAAYVQQKLLSKGGEAYPLVQEVWESGKANYAATVEANIDRIWNISAVPF